MRHITLNVGGTSFCTSEETLTKCKNAFFVRIAEEALASHENTIFVDRDPTHFRTVLNYLRDGKCIFPETWQSLAELIKEAHFYQLSELEKEGTQALRRIDAKELTEQANITSIISAIRGISESR